MAELIATSSSQIRAASAHAAPANRSPGGKRTQDRVHPVQGPAQVDRGGAGCVQLIVSRRECGVRGIRPHRQRHAIGRRGPDQGGAAHQHVRDRAGGIPDNCEPRGFEPVRKERLVKDMNGISARIGPDRTIGLAVDFHGVAPPAGCAPRIGGRDAARKRKHGVPGCAPGQAAISRDATRWRFFDGGRTIPRLARHDDHWCQARRRGRGGGRRAGQPGSNRDQGQRAQGAPPFPRRARRGLRLSPDRRRMPSPCWSGWRKSWRPPLAS